MAITIIIEKGDPATGHLTLSDHGHTTATPGTKIIWQIKKGSGVQSIDKIEQKAAHAILFKPPPSKVGNSTNWEATVNPFPIIENYIIYWTDEKKGQHHHDPQIRVNN